jgi:hypothetical protein
VSEDLTKKGYMKSQKCFGFVGGPLVDVLSNDDMITADDSNNNKDVSSNVDGPTKECYYRKVPVF